jgi:hypothetical protein
MAVIDVLTYCKGSLDLAINKCQGGSHEKKKKKIGPGCSQNNAVCFAWRGRLLRFMAGAWNNGMCFSRRSLDLRPTLQHIVDQPLTVLSICRLLNDNKSSSDPELRQASRESTFYSEYVIPGASSRGLDSRTMMALIDSEAPRTSCTVHSSQIRCIDYWIF